MRRTRRRPTALDLFAGCGGLTLGLKRAGFSVIGAVEIDPRSVAAYKANHKGVRVWERDISRLSAAEVMRKLRIKPGQLSVLAGCPPCQGFSILRTRNGSSGNRDRRNHLLMELRRFVRALRPKAVMLENVPGMAKTVLFMRFVRDLRQLGYSVTWAVKNAARYGVPQRRRRLILVAGRGFPVALAAESSEVRTVRDTIHRLPKPGKSGDPLHDMPERRSEDVARLIADIPRDGGSRLDLPADRQLPCHKRSDGFKDIFGRMAWTSVAPTITGGCFNPSKGRFLHPTQNRAITMREAALLQSFPRRYQFPVDAGKQAIALMIGNALPPEFVRRHALGLKAAIGLSMNGRRRP